MSDAVMHCVSMQCQTHQHTHAQACASSSFPLAWSLSHCGMPGTNPRTTDCTLAKVYLRLPCLTAFSRGATSTCCCLPLTRGAQQTRGRHVSSSLGTESSRQWHPLGLPARAHMVSATASATADAAEQQHGHVEPSAKGCALFTHA